MVASSDRQKPQTAKGTQPVGRSNRRGSSGGMRWAGAGSGGSVQADGRGKIRQEVQELKVALHT